MPLLKSFLVLVIAALVLLIALELLTDDDVIAWAAALFAWLLSPRSSEKAFPPRTMMERRNIIALPSMAALQEFENLMRNESSAVGMVFSTDRLRLDPASAASAAPVTYKFALTKRPGGGNVVVKIVDASKCTMKIDPPSLLFTPARHDVFQKVTVVPASDVQRCRHGLVHRVVSGPTAYLGMNVRIKVDVWNAATKTLIRGDRSSSSSSSTIERDGGKPDDEKDLQSKESAREEGNGKENSDEEDADEEEEDEATSLTVRTSTSTTTTTNEKIGEWIPEEVFETEEESLSAIRALAPLERSRSAYDFEKRGKEEFACVRGASGISRGRHTCRLAPRTPFETPFYVIDPVGGLDDDGWNGFPVVLILGGAHGSEPAGSAAAFHVAEHWRPRRGRLVIVPWANLKGLRANTRAIPGTFKSWNDLNRNFPLNGEPLGDLAKAIWALVAAVRPDVLFDLHEGWGVYSQLKDNDRTRLVNSKTFSKGSSVISTREAEPIAKIMLDRVNRQITAPERKFELIVPPVEGGLALKLASVFRTRSVVTETTKSDQALFLRVSQQLTMLGAGLKSIHVLGEDFAELQPVPRECLPLPPLPASAAVATTSHGEPIQTIASSAHVTATVCAESASLS